MISGEGSLTRQDVDTRFEVLANDRRRAILEYFITNEADEATLEELRDHLQRVAPTPVGADRLEMELFHVAVPKLTEAGLVDFDGETRTVRYIPDPLVERFVIRFVDRKAMA